MKTELLDARLKENIAHAAQLLQAGELVAFPTDTVYGVAAIITQPSAVAQLYTAKGRPLEKSIPILLADVRNLGAITVEINDLVRRLTSYFWPGGLTLVLPKNNTVPPEVSSTPGVAVRLPDFPLTQRIITAAGAPLAVTSANLSGQPSPRTADEVLAQLEGRIAAIVDGGPCPGGIPSTILDCMTTPPRILRAGAVTAEALRRVTPLA